MRQRVLMLTDFFPPVIGGLERHVDHMSRELAARGNHVAVATLAGSAGPGVHTRHGVTVHRITGWSKALKPLYVDPERPFHPTVADPGIVRALRRVIAQERPTIVQCHSWIANSFLAMPEARALPTLLYLHDYGSFCATKTFVNRGATCSGPAPAKCLSCSVASYGAAKGLALAAGLRAWRGFTTRVDRWVANSVFMADTASMALRVPRESVELVPSFLPRRSDHLPTHRPDFMPDGDTILFVGALGAHKGLNVLLEAFAPLADRATLLLLGTPQHDTPATLPPGVRLITNVPHDEVMAAWGQATLGVVPSVWPEPFGMVAVEAMATGTPVVASETGGLPDIVVDDETGLLVPPRDPDALRVALVRLLEDPALRARLGKAGRRRASRFSLTAAATAMERIHATMMERPPAPTAPQPQPTSRLATA